jgi:predicted nucleic acid-binding protein
MTYLLDVSALLAAIVDSHPDHSLVDTWVRDKQLAVCPISELGFLRVGTHPNAYNLKMRIAREALEEFITVRRVSFVAADLPGLQTPATKSAEVTDSYLAELAARHNLKLATLDQAIKHFAVEVIK